VVVHVTLQLVLLLWILMGLVVVLNGGVVVLVTVGCGEMLPGRPVPLVMDRVWVRMRRHDSFGVHASS
jgi:hypothetical protein